MFIIFTFVKFLILFSIWRIIKLDVHNVVINLPIVIHIYSIVILCMLLCNLTTWHSHLYLRTSEGNYFTTPKQLKNSLQFIMVLRIFGLYNGETRYEQSCKCVKSRRIFKRNGLALSNIINWWGNLSPLPFWLLQHVNISLSSLLTSNEDHPFQVINNLSVIFQVIGKL